jgi:outer membrane receptor protein involved in Fe transport
MNWNRKAAFCCLLIALLPVRSGHAETSSRDDEEIRIVASRDQPGAGGFEATTILDDTAITRDGAASLDQLLDKLPVFGTQGVNAAQNETGYGAAFVELRNLNFNRTLVLVDDRRFVLSGIKTDEAVDMNNIPLALIDHVDVFADGSEPRFGADAIAGVVNVVLKHDFEGVAGSAMAGVSGHGDGAADTVSATIGHNFTSANVALNISQSHGDPIPQSDRSWARDPITAANLGADNTPQVTRGEPATLGGHAVAADIDALVLGGGKVRPFNPATDDYDFSNSRYLRAGQDRLAATLLAHDDFASGFSAFAELSYVSRTSDTLEPPATLGLFGTAKYPQGFVIPASNPFNPFGQDVTLQRVLGEVGDQLTRSQANTARAVVGLNGSAAGGDWSVSFNHGETDQTFTTFNALNLTKVFNTLSGNPATCPTAQGCVAADYFGVDSLSEAAVNYIRYTDTTRSQYRENVLLAAFAHPVADLPAGRWTATVGTEYRTEFGSTTPDPVSLAGDQAAPDSAATAGGYRSREIFFDTEAPLLNGWPLARNLTANASARYSSYDRFGAFPTWKSGLTWQPVGELRLRATSGAGRRVPAITEAFGGSTATFLPVQDPCDASNGLLANPAVAANCRRLGLAPGFTQASPLIDVTNGGNPNLKPEASRDRMIEATLTPRWVHGLTVSADYYDIHVDNAINALSDADPNFIPDQCFTSVGLSSPICGLITRVPTGPAAGQISRISSPDQNIGAIRTDGIDVSIKYDLPVGNDGRLSLDWQNTFLLDFLVKETPLSSYVQQAGTFPSLVGSGGDGRYRGTLNADLEIGAWGYSWTARYIDGAKVQDQDVAFHDKAPGIFYHDAQVSWRLEPVTIRLGIDNVFDRKPPILLDGVSNTNLNTYDVVGRYFYCVTNVAL